MEQAISFTLGMTVFFISLSCLLHTHVWIAWFKQFQRGGEVKAVVLGAVVLMLSSLVVTLHPVWQGLPMLVTLLGVAAMVESIMYLLFPMAMAQVWAPFLASKKLFRSSAFVGLILGLVVLYISGSYSA